MLSFRVAGPTLAVLLVLGGPARPQDPPGAGAPAAPIVVAPPATRAVRLRIVRSETRAAEGGPTARTVIDASLRALGPTTDGCSEVEVKIGRVTGTHKSLGPPPDAEWDAATLTASQRMDPRVVSTACLAGGTIVVTLAPNGGVQHVQGVAKILEKGMSIANGEHAKDYVASAVRDASLAELVAGLLGAAPYPADGAGTWTRRGPGPTPSEWRMRRQAARPGVAAVAGDLAITGVGPPDAPFRVISGRCAGEIDLADGLPLRESCDFDVDVLVATVAPGDPGSRRESWQRTTFSRTVERLPDLPPVTVRSPTTNATPATLVIEGSQQLTLFGKVLTTEYATTYELELRGLPAGAGGAARLDLRFKRIRGRLTGGLISIGDYDSSKPLPADEVERSLQMIATAWAGTSVRLTLEPTGAIRGVEGIAAAVTAAAKRMKLTPDETADLAGVMTEPQLRGFVGWAFLGTPYEHGATDTWRTTGEAPFTARDRKVVTAWTHLRTPEPNGGPGGFTSTGTVSLEFASGVEVTFVTKSSSATGSTQFSAADGLPLVATSDIEIEAASPDPKLAATMRQSMRTRFERASPPANPAGPR